MTLNGVCACEADLPAHRSLSENTGDAMLTIGGRKRRGFCDGVTRRDFLKVGGLALGGLTLPDLLRGRGAGRAIGRSHKAVIMVFLAGGPPHQDMVDLKPDAPAEIRGEFKPIATNVPGLRDLRAHAPARRDDGQVRRHPLARRRRRRARRRASA